MFNNTTEITSVLTTGYNLIWVYVIWICYFFTTSIPNMVIAVTVMRFKALRTRKEYLIVAGLSFADSLNIAGYSGAGKSICELYLFYITR